MLNLTLTEILQYGFAVYLLGICLYFVYKTNKLYKFDSDEKSS
jgi:hypothetical protein